jgi:cytochrome b6-f complex iron-sulfur subunit
MKRDEFIKKVAVGGSILLTTPFIFNSCSKDESPTPDEENTGGTSIAELDLTKSDYDNLDTIGGFVYQGNVIIIRSSASNYIALSKVCTHQGCEVGYDHANSKLPCPCHQSEFDTNGNVLKGPATTKLKKYTTKLEGNKLTIT